MSIRTLPFLVLLLLSLLPFLAEAQTVPSLGGTYTAGMSLEVVPEIPKPFERVFAQIKSFSIDLDRATTTWYVNDTLVLSGKGKKQLSFNVGGVGTFTDLRVVVIDAGFGTTTRSIVFKPITVDFLWESPDSYTPPFYRGKALPSPESKIKIVAIPHDAAVGKNDSSPTAFVYTWSKDGKFRDFNTQSGYGKRALTFALSLFDNAPTIGVEVSSLNKDSVGESEITIQKTEPFLLLYEDRPLHGIWYESAVSEDFKMQNSESSLVAEPYFFSVPNHPNSDVSYRWRIGNDTLPDGTGRTVVLSAPNSGGVESSVSVSASHIKKILQSATKSFMLQFGEEESDSSSLFGNI